MNETIWRMSAVALAIVATTAIVAGATYAKDNEMFGKNLRPNSENMQAVKTALANNDYSAWLEAIDTDSPTAKKITEENFPKLIEINELRNQINALEEELKLTPSRGTMDANQPNFRGPRAGGDMAKNMEVAKTALDNNDYTAWLETVGTDSPIAEKITVENFPKLVEAHNLMQAGNFEEARQIRSDLGLNQGHNRK